MSVETTIVIDGDSSGATKALRDTRGAMDSSKAAMDRYTTSTRSLGSVTRTATAQLSTATGAMTNAGNAISLVNPQLGAMTRGLAGAAQGFGGLVAAINPVTLGLAAATTAITAGIAAWQRHTAAQREAAAAAAELAAEQDRVRVATLAAAAATVQANRAQVQSIAGIRQEIRSLDELDQQFQTLRASLQAAQQLRTDAAPGTEAWQRFDRDVREATQALDALNRAAPSLRDDLSAYDRLAQASGQSVRELAGESSGLADALLRASAAGVDANAVSAEIVGTFQRQGQAAQQLATQLQGVTNEGLRQLGWTQQAIDALRRYETASLTGAQQVAQLTAGIGRQEEATRRTATATRDLSAEMEAAFRASVLAGAESLSALLGEAGDNAQYASTQLARLSDEQLRLAGLSATTIAGIREVETARLTGIDLLGREVAAIEAAIEAERRKKEAAMEALNFELAAQAELEMAKYEAQQREILRLQQQKEEFQSLVMSMKQSLAEAGLNTAIGTLSDGLGDMFTRLGAGEKAVENLGKATGKAIGGMASQFGSLAMAQGGAMLLMPGLQGAGLGLLAAGAILKALGSALGGATQGAQGRAAPAAPQRPAPAQQTQTRQTAVMLDSSGRDTYSAGPITARDQGSRQADAERYGIDRARSYTG